MKLGITINVSCVCTYVYVYIHHFFKPFNNIRRCDLQYIHSLERFFDSLSILFLARSASEIKISKRIYKYFFKLLYFLRFARPVAFVYGFFNFYFSLPVYE